MKREKGKEREKKQKKRKEKQESARERKREYKTERVRGRARNSRLKYQVKRWPGVKWRNEQLMWGNDSQTRQQLVQNKHGTILLIDLEHLTDQNCYF